MRLVINISEDLHNRLRLRGLLAPGRVVALFQRALDGKLIPAENLHRQCPACKTISGPSVGHHTGEEHEINAFAPIRCRHCGGSLADTDACAAPVKDLLNPNSFGPPFIRHSSGVSDLEL